MRGWCLLLPNGTEFTLDDIRVLKTSFERVSKISHDLHGDPFGA